LRQVVDLASGDVVQLVRTLPCHCERIKNIKDLQTYEDRPSP